MLKFIGCLFIFLACSGLGQIIGSGFYARVREISALRTALQMLETEIVYSQTPLPEAFQSISIRSTGVVRNIFNAAAANLKNRLYSTVGEAFEKAVDSVKDRVSLAKDDFEILKSFGHSLGSSDIDGQVKSFRLVIKQLEQQEIKAHEASIKNGKMYKSLGLLSGLAIAIIIL